MAFNKINIGTSPNSRDGDALRTAFTKVNTMFDEVYTNVAMLTGNLQTAIPLATGNDGKFLGTDGTVLKWVDAVAPSMLINNSKTVTLGADGTLNLPEGGRITINNAPFAGGATIGSTPPVPPYDGLLWYDTVSGRTYVYYDASWVDANPKTSLGPVVPSPFQNGGKFLTNDGSSLSWQYLPTPNLGNIAQPVAPATTNSYDIGNNVRQWRDLYLSSAAYINGTKLSVTDGKLVVGSNETVATETYTTQTINDTAFGPALIASIQGSDVPVVFGEDDVVVPYTIEKSTDSSWDINNYQYTVPKSGYYNITAAVDVDKEIYLGVYKYDGVNDTLIRYLVANSSGRSVGNSVLEYLTAGDVIRFKASVTLESATIRYGQKTTFLMIHWVRG